MVTRITRQIIANAENKACPEIQNFAAATSWLDLIQTVGSF
jgi:hypothetical protein